MNEQTRKLVIDALQDVLACGSWVQTQEKVEAALRALAVPEQAPEAPIGKDAERLRDAICSASEWMDLAIRLARVPAVQQALGASHTRNCDCPLCAIDAAIQAQTEGRPK